MRTFFHFLSFNLLENCGVEKYLCCERFRYMKSIFGSNLLFMMSAGELLVDFFKTSQLGQLHIL